MIPLVVLLIAVLVSAYDEPRANYTGFKVIRVAVENEKQAKVIKELEEAMLIDLWNEPRTRLDKVMMSVSPRLLDLVEKRLLAGGMIPITVIEDLQKVIDQEKLDNQPSEKGKRQNDFDFGRYHNLDEIAAFLRDTRSKYSDIAKLTTIGFSYENRPLQGLRITSGESGSKPVIFLEVGIHAREWVTTATSLYFINELTRKYNGSSEIKELVDKYEWYIIPTVNPDGYVYTWTVNRNWRKTRSPNTFCIGTDANRNFDINFCGQGSSRNPCVDTYCGSSPFSEKETRSLMNITTQLGPRLKLYFAIHSFSQYWMYPYAYTNKNATNQAELDRLAAIGVNALRQKYQTAYIYGPINKVIYVASGSSIDWVYDKIGTRLTYALELRDTGRYGFLLPKEQIIPTAEETWDGIKALIKAMA